MQSKSILIVGTGYLGLEAAKQFFASGWKVFCTTRKEERAQEFKKAGYEPVLWDVLSPNSTDFPVVNLVLYAVGFDRTVERSMHDIYVDGLANTLERLNQFDRFIYISSTGVYGDADGGWVDETTVPHPADESGKVCLEAESVFSDYCDRSQNIGTILRLAGIYGPGRLLGGMQMLQRGVVSADPAGYLNLIHVQDAARIIQAVYALNEPDRIYNTCDSNPTTKREFYITLAKMLNLPEPSFDPSGARRNRGNRRISNRKLVEHTNYDFIYPDFQQGLQNIVK